MNVFDTKPYKRSRLLYIFEAALEYLVSLLVTGSFLATLTSELGFSDSLTAILSSIISLGCVFQLTSVLFRKKSVKNVVCILSVVNQLLFMLLYVTPLIKLNTEAKSIIFAVLIVSAYIIYNFAHPKKISWLMSLAEDGKRGVFTANKEIFSLIAGMTFSFVMGAVTDYFTESGNTRTAFIVSAAVIFVLMLLHTLCLVCTVEPEAEESKLVKTEKKHSFISLLRSKKLLSVTALFVLYYMANYASLPFYGTYQINELGFSLKFVAVLAMVTSVSRITVSKFWGRYADKNSFAKMVEKCFIMLAISYVFVICSSPANGMITFTLYNVFHGIAMGGINSALTNIVFDYMPHEKRSDALAVSQALSGVAGFVTTLLISPMVSQIQANGNKLFGMPIYAQQAVTVISLVFTVVAILYTRFVLIKTKKKHA